MFDLKCSMQAQLDNLWLKPEDLAGGLGIRVSSVRKWLDPELDCMPVKDAFDWISDQIEKLGDLTLQCLNDANDSYEKFGQHIVRWYRDEDLPDTEPGGLYNLASRLAADQLAAKGIECSTVYASRDGEWIEQNLDFPPISPLLSVRLMRRRLHSKARVPISARRRPNFLPPKAMPIRQASMLLPLRWSSIWRSGLQAMPTPSWQRLRQNLMQLPPAPLSLRMPLRHLPGPQRAKPLPMSRSMLRRWP